jgi:hypothetical protein
VGTRWGLNTWPKKSVLNLFLTSSCHWIIVFPMLRGMKSPYSFVCTTSVVWRRQHSYFCLGGFNLPKCMGILKIPLHSCHEVDCYY